MYTIKCPFCPDYYNSSKSHKCVSPFTSIDQADRHQVSEAFDPDRARVRAELYGDQLVESANFPPSDTCECGASKNPTDETCGKDYGPCFDGWPEEAARKAITSFEALKTGANPQTPEIETAAKPSRYNRGNLEVWDAIAQLKFDYMQGNVVKYISRYKDKNGPEDLVKAINYIIKMIAQETGEDYYELHKLTPEELAKRIKK